MRRYGLPTKRAAVDMALRRLDIEPMDRDEALAMEGAGWEGDLDRCAPPRSPTRLVILADTSAWIEFLRATGSPAHRRMRKLIGDGAALATTGPILMEVLAGARDRQHLLELERLLAGCEMLNVRQPDDFETAAAIHRAARAEGWTIARGLDCLIAAVAIRREFPCSDQDSDFETIAAVTSLEVVGDEFESITATARRLGVRGDPDDFETGLTTDDL